MTRKVIYISYMRLSDKVMRDWFIDDLIRRNVAVEYWDLIPMLFGDDAVSPMDADFLRIPRNYQEFQSMLNLPDNRETSFVMLLAYEGRTADIYRLLSKHDCRMFFLAWGSGPINRDRGWGRFLLRFFSNPARFSMSAYYKTKAILYKKLNFIKPFHAEFAAGRQLMKSLHFARKVVPINLVDYDHYVRVKSIRNRPSDGRFAVFLDIYLPHQTDLKVAGLRPIDSCTYYESLNDFFRMFEESYGIKIVIAAHPKANYEFELFGGREVYRGLTAELVKDADFVISHWSTSLSYAVLNLKPVVLIYTHEIMELYKYSYIQYLHELSDCLDVPLYNIDEITQGDQIVFSEVNKRRYEAYKYEYITSPESEQLSTQEIFLHELEVNF